MSDRPASTERIAELLDAMELFAAGERREGTRVDPKSAGALPAGLDRMLLELGEVTGELIAESARLRDELSAREVTEVSLRRANTALEEQIAVRTARLAEVNRNLRKAQTLTHIGSWDWDLVSGRIHWSDELLRIFQLEGQEVTPRLIRSRIHAEDQDTYAQILAAMQAGRKPGSEELRIVLPDGSTRTIAAEGEAMVDEQGEPFRVTGTVQDISRRKQIEVALRESEERYRKLSGAAEEGIAVQEQETFIDANVAMDRMFGYERSEVIGLTLDSCMTAESLRQVKDHINSGYDRPFEIAAVRKDGSIFPCQLMVGKPFHYQDKDLQVATFVDITELKRAEEARRESEGRYLLLAKNMSDVIWTADMDLRFTYISPSIEQMRGYTSEEAMEQTLAQVLAPSSFEVVAAVFDATLRQVANGDGPTEAVRLELEQLNKDGSTTWVEVSVNLAINELGEITGFQGITRDISERRKVADERLELEAKIQQGQKLESLGLLAGGIAHDFNNLLAGILGNASVVREEAARDTLMSECIKDIETAAKRASDLARQMLAYSGQGRFVVRDLDLNALVEEMGQLLSISIPASVTHRYDLTHGIPQVRADATQLRQIVMNLITNAADAIGDSAGHITISTGVQDCDARYLAGTYLDDELPPGVYVYIEVIDSGVGMDPGTMSKIFDPFFSTKFTGRGLGLAASLGIVRGHRGAIEVQSAAGEGTTFKVLFPASEQKPTVTEPSGPYEPGWQGSGTVLLVDDEETVRTMGQRLLRRLGFDVLLAEDGARALEIFRQDPDRITCVLLDLTMPNLDGRRCLRELRRVHGDVPVIMSSGYDEGDLIDELASEGLSGFIQKPYTLETLELKMKAALEDG